MTTKPVRRVLAVAGLCLLVLAASSGAVLAYINGGIQKNNRNERLMSLTRNGWLLAHGEPIQGGPKEVYLNIPLGTPKFDEYVNQLVAKAADRAAKEGVPEIAIETKRQIAQAAHRAIATGTEARAERITTGTAGPIEYTVGTLGFARWSVDVDRRGERGKTWPGPPGYIPFVAIRPVDRPAIAEIP